jgi:3-oxoacyl-[acyl-carrier-protein] synthase III
MKTAFAPDRSAVLVGLGTCLPARVVTNDDLAADLDTTHDWIYKRTGIARRRVAGRETLTSDLAAIAGRGALESAGRAACDLVLLATTTPDRACPATAPRVASDLGLAGVGAFDVSAVCSGFIYGLSVASSMITAGACDSALVIGAERYSAIIDPRDRSTALLFGDGAGAVLLERGSDSAHGAILHNDLGSDGTGQHLITIPPDGQYLTMQGRDVYTRAVPAMTDSALRAAKAAGWEPGQIDAFVGHQANLRILSAVAKRLGLPPDRVITNIEDVGNTAAASIPLALAWGAGQHQIEQGDRVVLTAFGGGLTWGSTALRWPGVQPVHGSLPRN